MDFTLESQTNSSTVLILDPLWDYQSNRLKFKADHDMLDGGFKDYLFGVRDQFIANFRYMQDSSTQLINEFWKNNDKLTFVVDASTYSVYISNTDKPFKSFSSPYQDLWEGSLTLREAD